MKIIRKCLKIVIVVALILAIAPLSQAETGKNPVVSLKAYKAVNDENPQDGINYFKTVSEIPVEDCVNPGNYIILDFYGEGIEGAKTAEVIITYNTDLFNLVLDDSGNPVRKGSAQDGYIDLFGSLMPENAVDENIITACGGEKAIIGDNAPFAYIVFQAKESTCGEGCFNFIGCTIGWSAVESYTAAVVGTSVQIKPLPGDCNNDGKVDIDDLVILSLAYESSNGDANWDARADLNDNGKVDIEDFEILKSNYIQ